MATISAVVGTISTLVAIVISVTQFRWAAEERRERKRLALASAARPTTPAIVHETGSGPIEFDPAPAPAPAGDAAVAQPVSDVMAGNAPVPQSAKQAGDLICGNCGEGNPRTRTFCIRCGSWIQNAPSDEHVRASRRPSLWPLIVFVALAIISGIVLLLS